MSLSISRGWRLAPYSPKFLLRSQTPGMKGLTFVWNEKGFYYDKVYSGAGVHKTGIRGIQDTRQIVDGKTSDIENNNKKVGSKFQILNIRQLMKQAQIGAY